MTRVVFLMASVLAVALAAANLPTLLHMRAPRTAVANLVAGEKVHLQPNSSSEGSTGSSGVMTVRLQDWAPMPALGITEFGIARPSFFRADP